MTLTDLGGNFTPISVPFDAGTGAFTALNVPALPGGSNYQFDAAHSLYLGNRQTHTLSPTDGYTAPTTRLWGGDANNDGKVHMQDLTCVGGAFNITPIGSTCEGTGSPDINADNKVNVQDLAITGGNFDKCGAQPWDWVHGTPVTYCP